MNIKVGKEGTHQFDFEMRTETSKYDDEK